MAGKTQDFSTNPFPAVDYRFLVAPFTSNLVSPFVYAGIGALSFDVKSSTVVASSDAKLNGWTAFIPAGIGVPVRLSDGDEVLKDHTDPLKVDTDGDGLSDGEEVLKYHSDPLKMDTDGGGVDDGTEVKRGTNPLDPADDFPKPKVEKLEVGKAMVLEGIVFQTGKAAIEPQSEETLMHAFTTLKENPEVTVEIRGYTDNVGVAAANKKLSLRRAEAVRAWLTQKGIDAQRIGAKGFGPANPIGDNATPEGRAKNRRIEFFRTH
jgi:outer membrane protein OmpA-like peptidoglycan-associated protein